MKVISNNENRSYFVEIIFLKKAKNIFVQIIEIQTNKARIQKNFYPSALHRS